MAAAAVGHELKPSALIVLMLLAGCAAPAPKPVSKPAVAVKPAVSLAEEYLNELGEVQGLSPDQARRELAELTTAKRLASADRFRVVVLVARDDRGDWERALKTLDDLPSDPDPRAQALLDTLRRLLHARLDLRTQAARTQELQDRIQQIKTLEKDLQQRNEAPKPP